MVIERRGAARPSATGLKDLDDAVLVNIFGRLDPLPDLFSICGVCTRFRKLGGDGRLRLRVAGSMPAKTETAGHRRLSFPTLREAVVASRPGDTIVMQPGTSHVVCEVAVNWPLRLLGGGDAAEDTVVFCMLGADSAFHFRASGVLANLSVTSDQGACVTHDAGRLVIDSCLLRSSPAPGLEHLFTPLVTNASSPPGDGGGQPSRKRRRRPEQGGVLSVRETKIRGVQGMRAVRTNGTGRVAGVRVITLSSDTLFWFQVDSAAPPIGGTQSPHAAAVPIKVEEDLPAWAQPGKPLFPVQQLPREEVTPRPVNETANADHSTYLELKSKAWASLGRADDRFKLR